MPIVPVTSETELKENFYRLLREKRMVSMTMEYLGEGADYYYSFYDNLELPNYDDSTADNYVDFYREHLDREEGSVAFVSLGCGNAFYEKPVLEYLKKNGRDFAYFGVDSSMAMLLKARKNLESLELAGDLLCADFGSEEFLRQMRERTAGYDRVVYGSFGGTMGCIDMEYLSSIFARLIRTGETLWFDVSVRPADGTGDERVTEHYRRYAEEPTNNDLDFLPLKNLGLDKRDGKFGFERSVETDTGALTFNFTFEMGKPLTVPADDGDIELAAGETAHLSSIRSYDADKLIAFLGTRGFAFAAKKSTVDMQLLFVKE